MDAILVKICCIIATSLIDIRLGIWLTIGTIVAFLLNFLLHRYVANGGK